MGLGLTYATQHTGAYPSSEEGVGRYPYPYGLSLLRGGVLASKEFPDG
jgi:hypothetical protein